MPTKTGFLLKRYYFIASQLKTSLCFSLNLKKVCSEQKTLSGSKLLIHFVNFSTPTNSSILWLPIMFYYFFQFLKECLLTSIGFCAKIGLCKKSAIDQESSQKNFNPSAASSSVFSVDSAGLTCSYCWFG